MSRNDYTLRDYARLAYEFAIRNPRVIELLKSPLTDDVANELLNTYRINIKVERYDGDSGDYLGIVNSLEELCLDYPHLSDIKGYESSRYVKDDYSILLCNKFKKIIPLNERYSELEDPAKTLKRCKNLIETRGRKLKRLMNGEAFSHYDRITFKGESNYTIDPTTNNKKTIDTDVKFIQKWLEPEEYLKFFPMYENLYP